MGCASPARFEGTVTVPRPSLAGEGAEGSGDGSDAGGTGLGRVVDETGGLSVIRRDPGKRASGRSKTQEMTCKVFPLPRASTPILLSSVEPGLQHDGTCCRGQSLPI